MKENKTKFFYNRPSLMMVGLKITCTCHQAKLAICCQLPVVVSLLQKFAQGIFEHAESKLAIRINQELSDTYAIWPTTVAPRYFCGPL